MKTETAKTLLFKLTEQVKNGFKRIKEMEDEGKTGLEHTAMREQINATLKTIWWLKEELPSPLLPAHFNDFIQMMNEVQPQKNFGWFLFL